MTWLRHNLANVFTLFRLCSLPFIVWTYGLYAPGAAWPTAIIVLVAALSDVADGYAARHLHAVSRFGKWVDPLVDRVFYFTILATLWYYGTLPWYAVLPLLLRDALLLLFAVPFSRRTGEDPRPSQLGKYSNLVLVCALQWFIIDLRALGWAFYIVGAALYLVTGLQYAYHGVISAGKNRGAQAPS